LNLAVATREFGIDVGSPDVEKVGQVSAAPDAGVYRRRFGSLTFEGVAVNSPTVVLRPDLTPRNLPTGRARALYGVFQAPEDLIVGMSVLRRLHAYIAYKERKLYITAANPGPTPANAAQ
jgi:hypothetical protein